MRTKTKASLDALQLSDIYSLLLFVLYKVQDVADYAVLSELCYLLDGNNLTRLLTYFAGKTVTFPSAKDLSILTNALLVYQYVNLENCSLVDALGRLTNVTLAEQDEITNLYLKILPIIENYNIDRSKLKKYDR